MLKSSPRDGTGYTAAGCSQSQGGDGYIQYGRYISIFNKIDILDGGFCRGKAYEVGRDYLLFTSRRDILSGAGTSPVNGVTPCMSRRIS
jgi:hypothetical protein